MLVYEGMKLGTVKRVIELHEVEIGSSVVLLEMLSEVCGDVFR